MKALLWVSALMVAAVRLPADTLRLRDGTVINGTYEGGGPDGVRFRPADSGQARLFELGRVSNISFDDNSNGNGGWYDAYHRNTWNSSTYAGSADRMRDQYGDAMASQSPVPQAPATPMPSPMPTATDNAPNSYIPAGTTISVRTLDAIDSDATQIGNTYQVTLAEPVVVNGRLIAPAGSNAV